MMTDATERVRVVIVGRASRQYWILFSSRNSQANHTTLLGHFPPESLSIAYNRAKLLVTENLLFSVVRDFALREGVDSLRRYNMHVLGLCRGVKLAV
jgi:hypothetical protein